MVKEELDRSLGKAIKGFRENLDMNQAQLAAAAKLSQGYLSQLENDEVQDPSARVLCKIAQALEINPTTLFEAAGYGDLMIESSDRYLSLPINLPLIHHIANYTTEQQKKLLDYLRALKDGVHEREPKIGAEH